MIIDIPKTGYQKGYLPKTGIGVFHPFFATANVAFRKEVLQRTGGFDLHCQTGEDIDLSIRVAKAGYELWFEPQAKITHFHRHTLKALLKQWFSYGYGHAYLFKKHSPKRRIQFYRYKAQGDHDNPFGIACILNIPFPFHGMIFLTSYHLMHVSLFATMILFSLSHPQWGIAALFLSLLSGVWYFGIQFDTKRLFKSLSFSAIRYLADGAYVVGGVLGGIRVGAIYLEATRSRKRI
jgi:cellulose synthase/poly-beta-1,6-N-acetylglucosamine synthase-like glycosyltransferase